MDITSPGGDFCVLLVTIQHSSSAIGFSKCCVGHFLRSVYTSTWTHELRTESNNILCDVEKLPYVAASTAVHLTDQLP